MINKKTKLNNLIKEIREEPYHLFINNCFNKSFKFKRKCSELNIKARVVVCIGLVPAKWFGHWVTILVPHSYGEVERERIELGQPPGTPGLWETVGDEIEPVIAVWF